MISKNNTKDIAECVSQAICFEVEIYGVERDKTKCRILFSGKEVEVIDLLVEDFTKYLTDIVGIEMPDATPTDFVNFGIWKIEETIGKRLGV